LVFSVGATQVSVTEPVVTLTVTLAVALTPALFAQVTEKVVVALTGPDERVPLRPGVGSGPKPLAVQDAALLELHCRFVLPPIGMLVWLAVSETTGVGVGGVTVTLVC
jgi:hypothetical protein